MRSTTRYLVRRQLFSATVEFRCYVHVLDILEAVSQVADKGVVDMLEHASFSDYVSNTLGSYD